MPRKFYGDLAKVSDMNQIVISKELRQKLGITPGDHLICTVSGNHLVITKAAIQKAYKVAANG